MGQLDGKVAIVTGAGRGIGKAIAILFAREGAKVAAISRSHATLDPVVDQIRQEGGTVTGILCDVSHKDQVDAAVAQVIEAFGTVDVLVNNAHDFATSRSSVLDATEAMFADQFASGLYSVVHFMQACFPYLKERQGNVINFGSGVGVLGAPTFTPYAACKEAVRAVSRVAAREWGQYKINVNIINPASMTDSLIEATKNPAVMAAIADNPLGMPGPPLEEVAPVALFLATDASKYITGHTFMVSGGKFIDAAR